MEHRWGQRFEVDFAVRLASKPYTVRAGHMTDLSLSGANITTTLDLRILSRIQVALVLPSRLTHATPVVSAYVARRHRTGIGVEWCDFAPQAVLELLRSCSPAHARERLQRRQTPPPALRHGS